MTSVTGMATIEHYRGRFLRHECPPLWIMERARRAALKSPCAKSQRGVVIIDPEDEERRIRSIGVVPNAALADHADGLYSHVANYVVAAEGFNGPPEPFTCDRSPACAASCNKTCLHAEERAIMAASLDPDSSHLELVHVKVDRGEVMPGGPPSCWQCSRKVLEHKLGGVWLYERFPLRKCGNYIRTFPVAPDWVFYTAREFHEATLRECKLGHYAERPPS